MQDLFAQTRSVFSRAFDSLESQYLTPPAVLPDAERRSEQIGQLHAYRAMRQRLNVEIEEIEDELEEQGVVL